MSKSGGKLKTMVPAPLPRARIIIVDDHPVVRRGVAAQRSKSPRICT